MRALPSPKNGSHTVAITPAWYRARYSAIAVPTSASATIGSRWRQDDGFADQPGDIKRSSRVLLWVVILGIVVVTAGAIALSVLLLRLMSAQLRSGLFQ